MGREVRKVPRGWEHPSTPEGALIPLHGRSYAKEAADWDAECLKWCEGWRPDYYDTKTCKVYPNTPEGFASWQGERPVESEYMPDFGDTADMFIMYENTTEGTPISPAFETVEELARWLADTGASAFAGRTATYEQWLATCRRGHAFSGISIGGELMSGVEGQDAVKKVCRCCKKNPPRYDRAWHCTDCYHALLPCCAGRSIAAVVHRRRRHRSTAK